MSDANTTKAMELLEALAKKLGVTVEYLWPYMVAEVRVNWLANLGAACLALSIGFIMLYLAQKNFKASVVFKKNSYGETITDVSVSTIVYSIISVVLLVLGAIGLFHSISTISEFFVPEATALQNILRLVK
jgi:hypothetical protein